VQSGLVVKSRQEHLRERSVGLLELAIILYRCWPEDHYSAVPQEGVPVRLMLPLPNVFDVSVTMVVFHVCNVLLFLMIRTADGRSNVRLWPALALLFCDHFTVLSPLGRSASCLSHLLCKCHTLAQSGAAFQDCSKTVLLLWDFISQMNLDARPKLASKRRAAV
jgi:hypothetical protein